MRALAALWFAAPLCLAQGPELRSWVMAAATNSAVRAIAPDVHSVRSDDRFVYVESAGLSLHGFGALQANQYDPPSTPRILTFRIARHPFQAAQSAYTPLGSIGVFVTGVPIYNAIGVNSYNNQNIWHQDAVAASTEGESELVANLNHAANRHSPIIGFAFDGFPIYGPFAFDSSGNLKRMASSYRLRHISTRAILPDGTVLTPAQEGPPVSSSFPLGAFAEDYEFVPGSGDLDASNGRFVKTLDYPEGTYAYFMTASWPYLIGPRYTALRPSTPPPARNPTRRKASTSIPASLKSKPANRFPSPSRSITRNTVPSASSKRSTKIRPPHRRLERISQSSPTSIPSPYPAMDSPCPTPSPTVAITGSTPITPLPASRLPSPASL